VGFAGQPIPNPGVYIVSVLGGPERRVSQSGRHPKWTQDGRGLLIRDRPDNSRPAGIFHIDLETLGRRQITQPLSVDGDWKFDVSPDGTTIAFIRYERSGVADIYTVPLAGGEPRKLTDWSATISALTWMPAGDEIVYDVAGQSLWRISSRTATPGKGTQITNLTGMVTSAALASTPSMSRPAQRRPARLAFQVEAINVGLRVIDLKDQVNHEVVQTNAFLQSRRVDLPGSYSADGQKVAFRSLSAGSPVQLWVANRDGSHLQQIKSVGVREKSVGSWSPDGRWIAIDATVGGNSDIYLFPEDGGEAKRLTTDTSLEIYPCWSQDGRWVYYSSNKTGRYEVWKAPAAGGPPTQITRNGGVQPAESIDGTYIYYLDRLPSLENGLLRAATLKMVPKEGGEERVVFERVHLGLWGVTTRGIHFVTAERDFEAIDLYDVSDGQVVRVGRLPFRLPKQFAAMTFSRDGRWALTNQVERREADLMMIDNFR
jgi:Tol biopolymer transport system component